MNSLWQDFCYAARTLRKSKGFTAAAALSLGLGIGGTTTIFSVLYPAVLRPLPFEDPGRLVMMWETHLDEGKEQELLPKISTFLTWKQQSRSFDQMAMAEVGTHSRLLTDLEGPDYARQSHVGPDIFKVLSVEPILGRTFLPEDFSRDAADTVVLSESYWRRRFGADPSVLGRLLPVRGRQWTIVGVVPDLHIYPWEGDVDFWHAYDLNRRRDERGYEFVGRLKQGVSTAQAEAELEAIREGLPADLGQATATRVKLEPLSELVAGKYSDALYLLFGAVGLVLLIACVNVTNLLLGRVSARAQEIAVRAALGAGRLRLVRQLLTESVLLSLAGGALGVSLASWGVSLFAALAPEFYPVEQIRVDGAVLSFALGTSLLIGVIFGTVPALRASDVNMQGSLKEGTRGAGGQAPFGANRLLVVSEISLALVLLAGAGLMAKTLVRTLGVDLGFDSDPLLTMHISASGPEYNTRISGDHHQVTNKVAMFYQELLQRVQALPGVESVGMISSLPPAAPTQTPFKLFDRPPPLPGDEPLADYNEVDESFFAAAGVPLLRGRAFNSQDRQESEGVAVVSETFARRFFPEDDALGKMMRSTFRRSGDMVVSGPDAVLQFEDRPRRIVGVAGDIRHRLRSDPAPAIYVPYRQHLSAYPGPPGVHIAKTLVMRTGADAATMGAALRKIVADIDRTLYPRWIMPMDELLSGEVRQERFWMQLLGLFAGTAMLLAAVGVYGVVSYSVSRRTHELGIRKALGAQRAHVFRQVGKEGILLSLAGVGLGVVAALGLTPLLENRLFGVSAADPATFILVSLVLVGVAFVASYIPARRAMKVEPLTALRHE